MKLGAVFNNLMHQRTLNMKGYFRKDYGLAAALNDLQIFPHLNEPLLWTKQKI